MGIRKELSSLLKNPMGSSIIISRGKEEREFLAHWLLQHNEAKPVVHYERPPLEERIKSCSKCGSGSGWKFGVGPASNGIMVILNPPTLVDKIEIGTYKKESALLLKKMFSAIGVELKECYITNFLKCTPVETLLTPGQIMKNCEEYTVEEIELVGPEIAIVMGDMRPLQNIVKQNKKISWFTVDHPITLLKNNELKRAAWETLKLVKNKIEEGK